MKHTLFLLLGLLVVPGLLQAQEKPPTRGKMLILDSERTLEGDIERVGDRYCVRRSIGETWVPATQVLRLCETKQDAYKFLSSQRNLNDPDERLSLAKWCHLQSLPAEALAEAQAAVRLRPDHAPSRRLLQHFEQLAHSASQPATTPALPSKPKELPLAVSAESLNQFATRIQPILMNTCVSCHSSEKAGRFQLQRVYEIGLTSNVAMQDNLAAVLSQLNVGEPLLSPFLIKAVSAHGPTGQAPLKGRQSTAFRSLEDWVKLTVTNQIPLTDRTATQTPALLPTVPTEKVLGPTALPPDNKKPTGEDVKIQPTSAQQPSETDKKPATTTTVPEPVDEFDPLIFNRQMHPQTATRPQGAERKE